MLAAEERGKREILDAALVVQQELQVWHHAEPVAQSTKQTQGTERAPHEAASEGQLRTDSWRASLTMPSVFGPIKSPDAVCLGVTGSDPCVEAPHAVSPHGSLTAAHQHMPSDLYRYNTRLRVSLSCKTVAGPM